MNKDLQLIQDHLMALLTKKHWTHKDIKVEVEQVNPLNTEQIEELFIIIKIKIGEHTICTDIVAGISEIYVREFLVILEVAKSIL